MSDDTEVVDAPVVEAKTEKAPSKPRAPKLVAVIDGVEVPLLKYPFPAKAAKFNVLVNGENTEAATTGGRGKEYTYMVINGTSFYVPGSVPAESEVTVAFPEGYAFEVTGERKSYYKAKKPKAAADTDDSVDTDETVEVTEVAVEEVVEAEPEPELPKASRRRR